MKKKHVILSFLMIALGALFLSFNSNGVKIVSNGSIFKNFSSVDVHIKKFLHKWNIPGASVALMKNNHIVYIKAFGRADEEHPVTPQSKFRIASLSKPITAVAIMKLIEEDKLSLDQKVFGEVGVLNDSKYSNIVDDRIKNITVRHLLEHTAGWDRDISSCGDPMFDPIHIAKCMDVPPPASSDAIIRFMLQQPLDFTPGTNYSYSNLGYSILGRVIEKVSGMSYASFVRQEILDPLQMKQTVLAKNLLCDKQSNEVKYFDQSNVVIPSVCNPEQKVPYPYGGFNIEAMDAHGGWISTAEDLALFNLGISKILSPASMNIMLVPSKVFPGYSKGWMVNERGSWWHTGCLIGTSTMMANVQDGISWVLLFNANPDSESYFEEMDRLMWNAINEIKEWHS
jgi:CubicO group peptidase (beta-lactamase class C family)